MKLRIRSLTPGLWPALEDLFGKVGACNGCECMNWRIGSAYRKRDRERNKAAFREIVKQGPPPGLLAFDGELAVGWCQLTPRNTLPWLDRAWRLGASITYRCGQFHASMSAKGIDGAALPPQLIKAAVKIARAAGAPALEAYSLDGELTHSSSWTGYASTFVRAGFKVVARHTPPRPIMRHDLRRVNTPSAKILKHKKAI